MGSPEKNPPMQLVSRKNCLKNAFWGSVLISGLGGVTCGYNAVEDVLDYRRLSATREVIDTQLVAGSTNLPSLARESVKVDRQQGSAIDDFTQQGLGSIVFSTLCVIGLRIKNKISE